MGIKKHTVDHLTKIPIGSSVSQIATSETSHKRPISHERPPKPNIKGWVANGRFHSTFVDESFKLKLDISGAVPGALCVVRCALCVVRCALCVTSERLQRDRLIDWLIDWLIDSPLFEYGSSYGVWCVFTKRSRDHKSPLKQPRLFWLQRDR